MAGLFTSVQNLVDALSQERYMAIFDDNNTGSRATVDASAGVSLCLARAHAEVTSYLPGIYAAAPLELPSAVSVLLQSAELDFALLFAYRRRPEYSNTAGYEPGGPIEKACIARMERLQQGTQQIAVNDSPPAKRLNTGGYTLADGARIITTGLDGTSNAGDF